MTPLAVIYGSPSRRGTVQPWNCSFIQTLWRDPQKYFSDTPETQDGTIEGQGTKSSQREWQREVPDGLDGGKGGRGQEEEKEHQIYDPVGKSKIRQNSLGYQGLYRSLTHRRWKDADTGRKGKRGNLAGSWGLIIT